MKILVNEGNANILLVNDKRKLYSILAPEIRKAPVSISVNAYSSSNSSKHEDQSMLLVPLTSMTSLRLDKTSVCQLQEEICCGCFG